MTRIARPQIVRKNWKVCLFSTPEYVKQKQNVIVNTTPDALKCSPFVLSSVKHGIVKPGQHLKNIQHIFQVQNADLYKQKQM